MGYLYHAIKLPNVITTISLFLNIFAHARFVFVGALTRLGIYKPPPEEDANSRTTDDNSNNYILILDGTSPSLVPVPIHVVTAAVKNRVPIVQYQHFLHRRRHRQQTKSLEITVEEEEDELGEQKCSICLERIELSDEMRELCNCKHVFHRACLDTWIDQGQVTCPLCRSMLLPPKTNLFSINRSCNNYNNNT